MRLLILFLLFCPTVLLGQEMYFPPQNSDVWETINPYSIDWTESEIKGLYDFLEENNTKAFMVLQDGKIVLEKYFDNFMADSVWYWASAGKSLTATMVGIAKAEGKINLDSSTSHYLGMGWTSLSPEQEIKITVRHQLSMTTGLDDETGNVDCTDPGCLKYKADPGTRWAYHNAPYTLLEKVVANATGRNYNVYVAQKLNQTIGMSGAFIKLGYNNVFFSKPRSMARFGLLMLNQGKWDGQQILTDTTYFNEMVNTSQNLNKSYGYLWWLNGKESFHIPQSQIEFPGALIPNGPKDMICALGLNDQKVYVIPSKNRVIIRMGNAAETGLAVTSFDNELWGKLAAMDGRSHVKSVHITENSIYPNPASDVLYFKEEVEKVRLINAQGQEVYTYVGGTKKLELTVSAGIYIVQYQTVGQNQMQYKKISIKK